MAGLESCTWRSETNVENSDVGTLFQRGGRATQITQEKALWLCYCGAEQHGNHGSGCSLGQS